MANIKKDIDITNIVIDKKRNKATGVSLDLINDKIYLNYDIIALNGSNAEIFKHDQKSIEIGSDRFSETHIDNLIIALVAFCQTELPSE